MGFKRSGVQVPSPIPTKNLYHWMQVFLFILHCLKKGLERVGIADTTAISIACLRQMMDTHRLPHWRDSVVEQVPSPIPKENPTQKCGIFFAFSSPIKGLERVVLSYSSSVLHHKIFFLIKSGRKKIL